MTVGKQAKKWRSFYESAWDARLKLIDGFIQEGETSIVRAIHRLYAIERKSLLGRNQIGEMTLQKMRFNADDMLPSGVQRTRKTAIDGEFVFVPYYTYPNHSFFLVDFVEEHGPFDAIIELGCGWGVRLFETFYAGLPDTIPLFGGELTNSGIALSRKLAKLDPRLNATFFPFDHMKANLKPVRNRGFQRVLVFTCHSLEQVEAVPLSFFAEVAGCAPDVTCVHLEPFGFQLEGATGAGDRRQREFFLHQGWNSNLAEVSAEAERAQILTRTVIVPHTFISPDPLNITSLMVWQNTRPKAKSPAAHAPGS